MAGTRLAGATVLITGGGSGIGRLMALEAARRGAGVVLWDLSTERLASVRAELEALGARVHTEVVDVSDNSVVQRAAASTLAAVRFVDVLINNAGVVSGRPLAESTEASIRKTYDVNTLALYWCTKAFLPSMIAAKRGHVVTIASAAGLVGIANQTDYAGSKHAAVGFTESLRMEMKQLGTGIRTTVVCPYYINTGMFDGVTTKFPLLMPILDEQKVATKVLNAVEKGREQLLMPPIVYTVPAMRMLPIKVFDAIADVLGLNKGMEQFRGRPGDVIDITESTASKGA